MPTAPTTPPSLSTITVVPNRATDDANTFSNKADTVFSEIPPMITSQQALSTWEEDTAQEVYDNAVEAATSATNAANSATSAASSANYAGEWSSLTGALNTPASTYHDGAFWQLETNLADVTLSEPSPTNADWTYYSGNRWVQHTASFTANANSQNYVLATVSATDITQPTFAANDFVVVKNSVDSTQTVRILNPSNTFKMTKGTVAAGDNLVLSPGDVVHLVARSSTILEEV